ncbi:zinc knuckle domain-containing protein [Besnoitia besnoiti]|uniref:Zinc knuckle domain-containing protein n=1 Tax=Besnoitia besnoiti TaxID=94643 RepID=A0A2A9MC07_BESBE|nr:zinc knuckle domain-containing protein [Besnoitia besnoiti]PFH32922.1 zinc knuckle domain-containing protein [Besnoitia besnoiti]
MPATVPHTRMPDSNRVPVSSTLRTHAIWRDTVGHDPYAPQAGQEAAVDASLRDKAQELLVLARLTGSVASRTPGACPKCRQVGHLAYQCRNMLTGATDARDAAEEAFRRVQAHDEEEDDKRARQALGIATDSEDSDDDTQMRKRFRVGFPGGDIRALSAEKKKRRKAKKAESSSSSDSSSSSSDSSSDSEDERAKKKRKRKSKKQKRRDRK